MDAIKNLIIMRKYCPECGCPIDDEEVCPECGYSFSHTEENSAFGRRTEKIMSIFHIRHYNDPVVDLVAKLSAAPLVFIVMMFFLSFIGSLLYFLFIGYLFKSILFFLGLALVLLIVLIICYAPFYLFWWWVGNIIVNGTRKIRQSK